MVVNTPSGEYRNVGVNLGLFALPNGDFNLNNRVDAADYVRWRDSIGGQTAYDAWRQHYGMLGSSVNSPVPAAGFSVPEPTGWGLVVIGLVFGLRTRSHIIRDLPTLCTRIRTRHGAGGR